MQITNKGLCWWKFVRSSVSLTKRTLTSNSSDNWLLPIQLETRFLWVEPKIF
jgi:hypothetical protein